MRSFTFLYCPGWGYPTSSFFHVYDQWQSWRWSSTLSLVNSSLSVCPDGEGRRETDISTIRPIVEKTGLELTELLDLRNRIRNSAQLVPNGIFHHIPVIRQLCLCLYCLLFETAPYYVWSRQCFDS